MRDEERVTRDFRNSGPTGFNHTRDGGLWTSSRKRVPMMHHWCQHGGHDWKWVNFLLFSMKLTRRVATMAVEDLARRNSRSRFIDLVDCTPADAIAPIAIAVRTAIGSVSGLKFQKCPTYDSSGTDRDSLMPAIRCIEPGGESFAFHVLINWFTVVSRCKFDDPFDYHARRLFTKHSCLVMSLFTPYE